MSTNLVALYSGDIQTYMHLQQYNIKDVSQDIILVVNTANQITYIVVDRTTSSVLSTVSLPYLSKIISLLQVQFPYINNSRITLSKICGMFDDSSSAFKLSTLFFVIQDILSKTLFIIQASIKDHDTKHAVFTLINGHLNVRNQYLDLMIKKNVSFNDYATLSSIQTYLMYIDVENSPTGETQKAFIRGIRILVTNEEKLEFQNTFPEITNFPQQIYPVVDVWSPYNKHIMFMKLTEDSNKVAFNFTTGMGFISFTAKQ